MTDDPATAALERASALQARLARSADQDLQSDARKLLVTLRNQRSWTALMTLAESLCRVDAADAKSRCLYAQALIETGALVPAIAMLEPLAKSLPQEDAMWAEAWGLLGRCSKQIFFDSVRDGGAQHPAAMRALTSAVRAYERPYRSDRRQHTWHGVNLLALALRARREGWSDAAPKIDPARLSRQLMKDLHAVPEAQRAGDPWFLPTLAEAALGQTLATGELQAIETVLAAYLQSPGLSAFQVKSTLRQFTELWALDTLSADTPGIGLATAADVGWTRRLVDILRARLMQLPGGECELTPRDFAALPQLDGRRDQEAVTTAQGQLEAVLGVDGPQTFAWWSAGIEAARSVAVVRERLGRRVGSGFLVRAGDLGLGAQSDDLLLLTNYHVINSEGTPGSVRPGNAEVVFEADDPGRAYGVAELLWTSPVNVHDAALLRLKELPTNLRPLTIGNALPTLPSSEEKKRPRVYLIGYPGGRELAFSFQDNELIDHEGPDTGKPQTKDVWRVHYRAPTEGGSSGSPVFEDRQWHVIALHHMGGKFGMPRLNGLVGSYAANEGLAMATLVAAVKAASSANS